MINNKKTDEEKRRASQTLIGKPKINHENIPLVWWLININYLRRIV